MNNAKSYVMITEFTCGIFTANYNLCGSPHWQLLGRGIDSVNFPIGIIDIDGLSITFTPQSPCLSYDQLIEIGVIMIDIKRQYKQLNND